MAPKKEPKKLKEVIPDFQEKLGLPEEYGEINFSVALLSDE
jgi:hypothetical protein